MRIFLAILIGKILNLVIKTLSLGGGSAAPGLYALKIEPNLVSMLASQIPQNIIITGTNGKTTTSRFITHFAQTQKIKVLRNSTGSNLERGIASSLLFKATVMGKIKGVDLGIWELDEAAFNNVALKINPQIIVFLNAFRDQLDRYGEVDSVVKKWKETLKDINHKALLILNKDDTNIAKLAKSFSGKANFFAVKGYMIRDEALSKESEVNEKSDFEAANIKLNNLEGITFQLSMNSYQLKVNLPLPGIYHIYDFLASFGVGYNLNLDSQKMIDSLASYNPAFGRVEKLSINGKKVWIFLIKNPAGTTQVLQTLSPNISKNDSVLVALNDNFADGTDVSWIWDSEFELLAKIYGLKIIVSGARAADMALRLKYAGIDPKNISINDVLEKAFKLSLEIESGNLFILPTYTALLTLQRILTKDKHKESYWRDD
ncbi:DUF1727 domain-containing protein [Candidatus Daviesbacteria bacterium]|nr:DUF1727 domain-containing protein [Candidatus Daviesbacteria bacterium]